MEKTWIKELEKEYPYLGECYSDREPTGAANAIERLGIAFHATTARMAGQTHILEGEATLECGDTVDCLMIANTKAKMSAPFFELSNEVFIIDGKIKVFPEIITLEWIIELLVDVLAGHQIKPGINIKEGLEREIKDRCRVQDFRSAAVYGLRDRVMDRLFEWDIINSEMEMTNTGVTTLSDKAAEMLRYGDSLEVRWESWGN